VSTAATAPPSVKDVMRRAGAYVDAYGERASIVVATERYRQRSDGNRAVSRAERSLTSEFAIVQVDTPTGWQGFRDVLEVDGRPLADRENRLVRALLADPGRFIEARRLSEESARYNIGTIERNFNVPTAALFFFASEHLDRFAFSAKGTENGVWHIAWKEKDRPTFIRSPEGTSIPSEGEIWVDPTDGTIHRTVLTVNTRGRAKQKGTAQIDVRYQFVAAIGRWMPVSMKEDLSVTIPGEWWEKISGEAEYSNYRQFTTSGRIK
jgi:hypothetical protein